ncbi:thiamine ABC transporter substrate binding subunit [Vespertiliibacter pulmonis]|uniref:Thiamine transport system substrate-binding protein n=1 Tax=Vespertiliibacter pulmonis TaxID=1443036 RepID=A0A3N4VTM6_9PAST|nr:thiamine ABC transporter substrate binding subunit [Vespertiliibacter pulmonis]QLB20401.1 thiamine ABC transporter substrate binding subunit [Vespertiliibacter pulmonis]RPE86388.1 thiamine transport system substrate-binding protein [Vespertiliibacter pulmonis]
MKLKTILALSSLGLCLNSFASQPTLTVYTYNSFANSWGAAKKLEPLFEQQCQCDLKFIPFENGVTMFNRIRLEGKKSKADVMLGIDNFLISEAERSGLFIEHNLDQNSLNLPTTWQNKTFVPYDYSEYAFIYDKRKVITPPQSLKELVGRQDLKIIYQDPRTSTVGRGLLFWINQVYGQNAGQAWKTLAKHTVTIGKGWSETYSAFLKGEADLVLSYTTSPLYHQWHEQDNSKIAAPFSEGHLLQIEVGAITKTSKNPTLAREFLHFLQQPEAQEIIAYHNVMKPVIKLNTSKFNQLPNYSPLEFTQPDTTVVKQWLATWQKAISQ